jgi:hypothetical protein
MNTKLCIVSKLQNEYLILYQTYIGGYIQLENQNMEAVQHIILICEFAHHGFFYSWKSCYGKPCTLWFRSLTHLRLHLHGYTEQCTSCHICLLVSLSCHLKSM